MKTVLKGKPQFLFTAVLASVLYCCAAQAADKTITAHIVLDSQLGTTTIDDEGEADARVVIDAMEDNPDTNEQGATWSYAWSHIATEYRNSPDAAWGQAAAQAMVPNVDADSNTITTDFGAPGYYRVRFQVSIEFKPVTGDDVWKGIATAEASQIVIGGDFTETGDKNLRFYCGEPTNIKATVTAPLQPVGTTWTWITSASLIVEENEATPQPEGSITTVEGTPVVPGNRHISVGSEWVQIIYSLNGVTWSSAMHNGYTVFKPTKIKRLAIQHGGDFNAEGKPFYLSKIWYTAEDQYGGALAHVPVNETFGAFNSSTTHPTENWATPDAKGGTADADGIFPDDIFVIDTFGTLNPTPQIPVQGQLTQELVQSGQQKYYLGSSNPGKGCLMQTGTLKYYIDHADHE